MIGIGPKCPVPFFFSDAWLRLFPPDSLSKGQWYKTLVHFYLSHEVGMAGISYLVRRGGTRHFRAVVPRDLRSRPGRAELRVTSGTGRIREAREKAFALAAFTRRLLRVLRGEAMADLTSKEILTIVRREFARILEEDMRSRMRFPGEYDFEVFWPYQRPRSRFW